jgi:hypothetical protein
LAAIFVLTPAVSAAEKIQKLWFYASANLLVDKNVENLTVLINRASAAGYNGMVLTDVKFHRLGQMPARYFENIGKIKRAAAAAKIEVIPCLFPVGYSEGLLANDPNLAEGMPVRDALFVVHDGSARLVADPGAILKNGGFEDWRRRGW